MGQDVDRYRVYKNGAVFDKDKGRIVALKPELATKNTQITKENTSDFLAKRLEKKRNIISEAAAAAVERDDYRAKYGDDAWIAAIAEAAYIKATTPDDPKAIDAARFLLQETGLSEAKQAQPQGDAVTVTLSAQGLQALAAMLAGNGGDNSNYRKHGDVVDAAGIESQAGIEGEAADSGGEKQ
jgi:hypothetical protein